jgi:hypothetical protein
MTPSGIEPATFRLVAQSAAALTLHKLSALMPKTNQSMLFRDICAVRCENYMEHNTCSVDKKQSSRILRHEVLYKYPLIFKKCEIDGDETGH